MLRRLLKRLLAGRERDPVVAAARAPMVSVVLGSYNRRPFLETAIESVRNNGMPFPYETIVVDGGSSDGSLEWLVAQKDIVTIVQHNRGEFRGRPVPRRSWGYFMNLAFKAAQGKYVLMISDDCLVLPDAVARGVECFEDGLRRGERLGGLAFYFRNWPQEPKYYVQDTLGGKTMVNHGLFLRDALEKVGWIDEDAYRFYKADGDLCLRLWHAGYTIQDCPEAIVEHYFDPAEEIRASNSATLEHDRAAYLQRWQNIFYFPDRPERRQRRVIDTVDVSGLAEKAWGQRLSATG